MKLLLELIARLFGKGAVSRALGSRTNVIKLADNDAKRFIQKELNILEASDEAVRKGLKDAESLIADIPKMNDQEILTFTGNLRRLDRRVIRHSSQAPAPKAPADIIDMKTQETVPPEGIASLTEKAGQKAPPGTLMGNLESRIKQLEASGEDLSKMKGQTLDDIMKGEGQAQQKMSQLQKEGLVKATASDIMIADIKSGKLEISEEMQQEILEGSPKSLDYFRRFYGEDALEVLDSLSPDLAKIRTSREAAEFAKKQYNFEADMDRPPGSIDLDDAKNLEDEFGIDTSNLKNPELVKFMMERKARKLKLVDPDKKGIKTLKDDIDDIDDPEDPEGFAVGGRVGFRFGTPKKIYNFLKKLKKQNPKKQLTDDEIQDLLDELNQGSDALEAYSFDGTVGDAQRILKENKAYEAQMFTDYKAGRLDPKEGDVSQDRLTFLKKKAEEAEMSGDSRIFSFDEADELEYLEGYFDPDSILNPKSKNYYKFTGKESMEDLYELERLGKITRDDMNVFSKRYIEYLDAEIINKEKLYTRKEWEKTPETIKNKTRARIDPDWKDSNFGEDYDFDQVRGKELEGGIGSLSDKEGMDMMDKLYPDGKIKIGDQELDLSDINNDIKLMNEKGLQGNNAGDYDKFVEMQLSGELGPQQQMKTIKMELRNKYSRYLDDETMDVLQASDDPQKVAEAYSSIREAAEMQKRGSSTDEIYDVLSKTPRTKQANGTSSQGLDYLMGVERRGYANGPMNILPDSANNPFYSGWSPQNPSPSVDQFTQEELYNNLLQQQQVQRQQLDQNDNSDDDRDRNINTTTGNFNLGQILGPIAAYATGIPGLSFVANAANNYFNPQGLHQIDVPNYAQNIDPDRYGDFNPGIGPTSFSTNPGIGFSNTDGDIESDPAAEARQAAIESEMSVGYGDNSGDQDGGASANAQSDDAAGMGGYASGGKVSKGIKYLLGY